MPSARWRRSWAGAPEFDFEQPPVLDGARLHREVPAERWCVTRVDLAQLRHLAARYVAEGRVAPTELDPFSASDGTVGPCIHTVNAQLIMPITRRAGGASWALMLHPEGLLCDLFVTHGWAEGIFEFIDKVLHSWPPRAHSAYCCMLSNPQCLDISGMLGSPRESPFARALLAAPTMLVVPNHTSSIYSRVWCAYEAYLAYSESKEILTASARAPHFVGQVTALSCVIAIGASTATFVTHQYIYDTGWISGNSRLLPPIALSAASLFAASFIRPSELTRAILYAGAFSSCLAFGFLSGTHIRQWSGVDCSGRYQFDCTGAANYASRIHAVFSSFVFCVCIVVAEADRLYLIQRRCESEELRKGYTGSLRDAESTVQEDKEKIMQELTSSGLADDVDQAIDVVLNAGALTQTLRTAILRVGMLEQAGCQTLSMAVLTWSSWVAIGGVFVLSHVEIREYWRGEMEYCQRYQFLECQRDTDPHWQDPYCNFCRSWYPQIASGLASARAAEPDMYIAALCSLQAMAWLAMYCCIPWDRRIFAVRALARVMGLALLVALIVVPLMHVEQVYTLVWSMRVLALVVAPAALALSWAGPARTAAIPWLGPPLVRGLMARRQLGSCRAAAAPAPGQDGGQRRPVGHGGSTQEAAAGASRAESVEGLGVP